jgi:antitoxin (DNA-binding transcriptional repressor) of toxin-antitoxin stability system
MKTMAISVFKANALRLIDEVSRTQEGIVITKRDKAMAELVPYRSRKKAPVPGRLSSALVCEGDIVSPLGGAMWESTK